MLIGDDECYLRIERVDGAVPPSQFRLEARSRVGHQAQFFGFNDLVLISNGAPDRAAFDDFAELRSHRVALALSVDGSLELRRDLHGNIDVLFAIGYSRLGPHWKVAGDVRVEGEFTQQFLREFRGLVFPDPSSD